MGTTILDGTMIRHGDPGDPPTDDANHTDDYRPVYPIPPARNSTDPGIVAREGAIGPAPNPANNSYLALEYYKQLVPNAEVTLPGSTCPACVPQTIPPTGTWTPAALADLVERLGGAVVATHSQSGIMGHHMTRILKERGKVDLLKALITIEGSCSLPMSGLTAADFDNIPYLALKGDYAGTSAVCQTTVDEINARRTSGQGRARADYIKLDDPSFGGRFNGTTHMMMLGQNNLEIADIMLDWVADHVRGPRGRNDHRVANR
jgi:hypothetical protein